MLICEWRETKLFYPSDVPEEGEVKLYYSHDIPDYHRGLLQVWLNSRWGNVTDSSWTIEDTNVVCRQLGRNGKMAHNSCVAMYILHF